MGDLPSCGVAGDSAKLAAFRANKTEPVTPRNSILPKRRLLATAVAFIVSSAAQAAQAPSTVAPSGTTTQAAPVATCALGSFFCPPRPVNYNMCRPNAMLGFYEPQITKDTSLRETAVTDVHSGLD